MRRCFDKAERNKGYLQKYEIYTEMQLYSNFCIYMALDNLKKGTGNAGLVWKTEDISDIENLIKVVNKEADPLIAMSGRRYIRDALRHIQSRLKRSDRGISVKTLLDNFALSDFEFHCFMLLFSAEIDKKLQALFGILNNDMSIKFPTYSLCMGLWGYNSTSTEYYGSFNKESDFFNYFLLHFVPMRLHPGIMRGAQGQETAPGPCIITPNRYADSRFLNNAYIDLEKLYFKIVLEDGKNCVALFFGDSDTEKESCLISLMEKTGHKFIFADGEKLFKENADYQGGIKDIQRECKIYNAFLCICNIPEERYKFLDQAVSDSGNKFIILFAKDSYTPQRKKPDTLYINIELKVPDIRERHEVWREAFKHLEVKTDNDMSLLANNFLFTKQQIYSAISEAKAMASIKNNGKLTEEILYKSCQNQFGNSLSGKAQFVPAVFTWEDIIMPPAEKANLRKVVNFVRYKEKVLYDWNFAGKMPYGKGVSVLFYGAPGTGKTMAVQVLGNELNLSIYRVNIPDVVSKYIGETEQNLNHVFNEAKKLNVILFFDEADSLFSKRTEQKDSNDKYANMEMSFLLQKMEEHEGITVMATNFYQNIDEAMVRRLTFSIKFSMPGREDRLKLWRSVTPKEARISDNIDYEFLADKFELSGANIKSIMLHSAFEAAYEDTEINMRHIIDSMRLELGKYQRVLLKQDLGIYAED